MITETAAAARPSTGRPRRLGDGMLTPVEVLEFRNPQTGRVELMRPGRDRASVHWFGYRETPRALHARVPNKGLVHATGQARDCAGHSTRIGPCDACDATASR